MNPTGRTPLIAGNWKMHKTTGEAEQLHRRPCCRGSRPPTGSTSRSALRFSRWRRWSTRRAARGSQVYAQNMHHAAEGAFTGEVSAPMLVEIGVHGVILGHSERRELFGETDRALQLKVPAALAAGLMPILCVGETEDEREAGDTERKLRHQVQEDLARVDTAQLGDVVIAYEPIWAIGTGRVATPEQAQEAIAFIRALVADRSREQARADARPVRRQRQDGQLPRAAARCPTWTARSSAARASTPESFAAIVESARG